MRFRLPRRVLLVLPAVLAFVALPGAASASITPSLVLNPSTVSAGTIQPLDFNLTFSPSGGDYPTLVNLTLPPGLLLDIGLNGGACLNSTTPTPGCQLGSGTASSTLSTSASLWLVKGPTAANVAGVLLENALGIVVGSGSITLRTTPTVGVNVALAVPPDLSALSLDLSTVRAPTSCPATPATVGVSAISADVSIPQTATTPLPVTACGSLPFSPKLAATIDQEDNGAGAAFTATATESDTGSATQAFEIDLPGSILPNVNVALGCLLGTPCTIGTASLVSPLLPNSALSNGTVRLGGSVTAPALSVTFPAPYPISLTGAIDISTEALTFNGIPDLPLSSLAIVIGGGSSTQLFTTNCAASNLTTKLTPWDGAASQTISAPITFGGTCPATPTTPTSPTTPSQTKPTVSGASLGGVVNRTAKLAFTAEEGKGAKPIKRIAISLPHGLSFSSSKSKLTHGIVVNGAHDRRAKFTTSLKHGVLTITLASTSASAKVTIASPSISVGPKLAARVSHQLKTKKVSVLKFKLTLTDSGHTATAITIGVKPKG